MGQQDGCGVFGGGIISGRSWTPGLSGGEVATREAHGEWIVQGESAERKIAPKLVEHAWNWFSHGSSRIPQESGPAGWPLSAEPKAFSESPCQLDHSQTAESPVRAESDFGGVAGRKHIPQQGKRRRSSSWNRVERSRQRRFCKRLALERGTPRDPLGSVPRAWALVQLRWSAWRLT